MYFDIEEFGLEVTDGKTVEVSLIISDDGEEMEEELPVSVVEIDGDWYIGEMGFDMGFWSDLHLNDKIDPLL